MALITGSQKCQGLGTWGPSPYLRVWSMGDRQRRLKSGPTLLLEIRKGHVFPGSTSRVNQTHLCHRIILAQSLVICYLNDFCFSLSCLRISQCPLAPCVSDRFIFPLPLQTSHPITQRLPLTHKPHQLTDFKPQVLYQLCTFSLLPCLLFTIWVPVVK